MEKRKEDTLIFKISILSLSLLLMLAPQIAAALPLMYHAFPGVSQADVETLATISNFGVMIGLLISPFVIQLLGERKTVIIGLIISLIAGTFPMYATNYMLILISRFLLGFGIGLFNSLAVSLLSRFYTGDTLSKMLGYESATGSVGAAIGSFSVGYLVLKGWHMAFAIFLIALPILILFVLNVPLDDRCEKVSNKPKAKKEKQHLNGKVIGVAFLAFLIFLGYMPLSYKMPELLVSQKIATMSTIAVITGFSTLIGIPISASYGFVHKKMQDKTLPLGTFSLMLGMLALLLAKNMVVAFIGIVLAGIGFSLAVPFIYDWIAQIAPEKSVNLGTTCVLILGNIGAFISPIVINALGNKLGGNDPHAAMLVTVVLLAILFGFTLVHYFVSKAKKQN